MEKEFLGQTVVVTGASAGLGRAIVREFARHGANIGLLARGPDGLHAAKKEVENYGGKALVIPVDVSNAEEVEQAANQVEQQLGPIDIWINNAMVSVFGPFKKIEAAEYKRVTEVTYLGQVYGTAVALKRMLPRDRGTIILIGSALAYRGIPLQSAYCGAKHGIHGFFESLRSELIRDKSNIRLTMVQLPAMNTPQFGWVKSYLKNKPRPMGIIYEPEVAARAILRVALKHERELYVGCPTVKTIIGNKIVPDYLDHYLAKTGFDGQQTSERADPDRENNLWQPVPGDHGARGTFDAKSKVRSPQAWVSTHKKIMLLGVFATLALGMGLVAAKKRS
ncbi:MAG TPA: SDR family oxidoreductase [Chitinophagaceae bacterium]|nr:SDR family oxidoreductase [Chitinophagaceae bacterium]